MQCDSNNEDALCFYFVVLLSVEGSCLYFLGRFLELECISSYAVVSFYPIFITDTTQECSPWLKGDDKHIQSLLRFLSSPSRSLLPRLKKLVHREPSLLQFSSNFFGYLSIRDTIPNRFGGAAAKNLWDGES